ncbi:hypothetical protein [Indioceanicola profundi]|uniref:hypothetical protein n=1 Tax=Indioceanicola profundi TaxID=2220096 RepID=UPI000E6AA9A3|nr:hypothetical protein [Indioceanicola profundi]
MAATSEAYSGVVRPVRATSLSTGILTAFTFFLIVLSALPLLITDSPPVFDYPNHLARVHILAHLDEVPAFAANFTLDSLFLPNVLADLILLALEPFLGIELAGKVLLLLLVTLTVSGTVALGTAAAGRRTVWPLLVAALVWNEVMVWGFLNYVLGVGLLLWALAAWLHLDRVSRTGQLASGVVFGLLLFLAHMVAFGLFAVAIAVLELARAWTRRQEGLAPVMRRLVVSALIFVPALALFWISSPASGLPMEFRFAFTAWQKFSPFTRLLSTGNTVLDVATLALVVATICILLSSRRVKLHPGLGLVALAFVVMVLTLPYSAMGSYFLDSRIAPAAVILLTAALIPARPSPRLAAAFCLALVAVVGTRGVVMARDWAPQDQRIAAIKQTLQQLPSGAILVPAEAAPFELGDWTTTRRTNPAHEHTATYAAIHRDAVVVNLFARKGQNPLIFTPAESALLAVAGNPIARAGTDEELVGFLERVNEAARSMKDRPRVGVPGIYVIVFHRGCGTLPKGLPVQTVACESDHMLMRMLPAKPENEDYDAVAEGSSS